MSREARTRPGDSLLPPGVLPLLDLLLWSLVLAGVESVVVSATYARDHFLTFVFPYSHGLLGSLLWSALAAAVAWAACPVGARRRGRLALVVGGTVLSHVLLDLLVHVPDLPLAGDGSPKLGLGLWRAMPFALVVEVLLAVGALVAVLRAASVPRRRAGLLVALVACTIALTVAGPYGSSAPPPPAVLAASSLGALVVVALTGFWVEGRWRLVAPETPPRPASLVLTG